jgi:squalene synthase HpnC
VTTLDPQIPPLALLPLIGPEGERTESAPVMDEAAAVVYCRGLADSHYENFSVLSRLVPEEWRDDYAAVYGFCRWADDLGDETGRNDAARARSVRLLGWWRDELNRCFAGQAEHPVFLALRRTIGRHSQTLTSRPFLDLIDAFEQDQRVTAYETWEQVIDYCRRSADPVGRIVLAIGGYGDTPDNAERYRLSDRTCTALQLINFWQDVRRDLLDRDRVYIPSRDTGITPDMLRDWAHRPDDPTVRVPYILAMRPLVERTAALFAEGRTLPALLDERLAPIVQLFGLGGEAILKAVERIGCATLWERPRLSGFQKAALVGRVLVMTRFGRR